MEIMVRTLAMALALPFVFSIRLSEPTRNLIVGGVEVRKGVSNATKNASLDEPPFLFLLALDPRSLTSIVLGYHNTNQEYLCLWMSPFPFFARANVFSLQSFSCWHYRHQRVDIHIQFLSRMNMVAITVEVA